MSKRKRTRRHAKTAPSEVAVAKRRRASGPVVFRQGNDIERAMNAAGMLRAMLVFCPVIDAMPNPADPPRPKLVPEPRRRPTICPDCGRVAGAQESNGCGRMLTQREAILLFAPRELLERDADEILHEQVPRSESHRAFG